MALTLWQSLIGNHLKKIDMILGNALDVFQMILPDGGIISFSAPGFDQALDLASLLLPTTFANHPICMQKIELFPT